ncbi:prephenate dehydrogenase [Flavilitoribacter nigricans]|uniref:Prephenate dehydrogenase n=1 Tax=Flavilitoribacter nigricans (strain ATCC 23147 / DSM 23189 / NBRC 102662 / NCIMB 1420 / SS-2) TaxID=1122177 RepID=A0A2D0N155_FLAN2|nr:prephenate dehydrogenase [Flavilitoribacter nigricans]PHN01443.1 prephenate dehydrogenase [Flavilitoribacter nigricans DSM 23189 = NBRC 102662]
MNISIIGIGLIGGSLAITLKENGFAQRIIGVDVSRENLDKAIRRRLIDEDMSLEDAVAASDIIVLSTPVDVMLELLPKLLDLVDRQVIMDVGSTKSNLLQAVSDHPKRGRLVATHPMAGTEYSGPEAAIPGLFDGKCTVLVDAEKSDIDALERVQELYLSIPMKMVRLDSHSHDVHTAYVSHISHISSFALALTVLAKEKDEDRIFELASGGFSSTVRLAKSSPDMWAPIFRQNRDNLLDVLDEHINQLARFRSLLIKKDFATFYELMKEANQIKKIIK